MLRKTLKNSDLDNLQNDAAFPKPGKKPPRKLSTSRPLSHNIEVPTSRKCVNCENTTGTEVYHHAESTRIKMLSGGGIMGGKINDKLTAWLCNGLLCGIKFDIKPDKESIQILIDQHDLFTFECIFKTWLI